MPTEVTDSLRTSKPSNGYRSFARFLIVGVLSYAVDTGLLMLLHELARMWVPLAAALAFLSSVAVNFGLNRQWSFVSDGAVLNQLVRYFLMVGLNLGLTVLMVTGLTRVGLSLFLSKTTSTGTLAVLNYFISRWFIFSKPEPRP